MISKLVDHKMKVLTDLMKEVAQRTMGCLFKVSIGDKMPLTFSELLVTRRWP